ncbi:MAG: methionyl-tRNA formyltransferase [Candidatus Kapabacteria bacterium]|nr:methionyl-tRNA formyltransferase [Candidatus Kapabacteria bacterium]
MSSIIFMGTPEFAVPALEALHREFGVSTVVTVPDRQKGRGLQTQPSAVKVSAMELGITDILQPASLRDADFVEQIRQRKPLIICVIAFRILPRAVYTLAERGAFNVHASLLPKYRGAAPINHAILNGETTSGVTSFLLNDVVDTGTVIEQRTTEIRDEMAAGDLYEALMPLAADCAVSTTKKLLAGGSVFLPQDDSLATPAPKIFREQAGIDWSSSREHVRNFIRAHSPTPAAWTVWNGDVLKITAASRSQEPLRPGEWRVVGEQLIAGCADGALSLDEVQLPGKRRMHFADIVRGYRGLPNGTFSSSLPEKHQ